jgi:hypothetical protein
MMAFMSKHILLCKANKTIFGNMFKKMFAVEVALDRADAMVDNHGVPSHEWCQPFAGYNSPPRFQVSYHVMP